MTNDTRDLLKEAADHLKTLWDLYSKHFAPSYEKYTCALISRIDAKLKEEAKTNDK